jgi:hypothetical protein
VDLADYKESFATGIWRQRYHWGEAGLRYESEGLAIFNPENHNTRNMFAFYDTVPNATYGPMCRWGNAEVSANIRFQFGDKPVANWGKPYFSLLSRVDAGRQHMYFLRIKMPGDKPQAILSLGLIERKPWQKERTEVFAETELPLSENDVYELSLMTINLASDNVRLVGICRTTDGKIEKRLTSTRTISEDDTMLMGEVGFEAYLHEFADMPASPNNILVRSFVISSHVDLQSE